MRKVTYLIGAGASSYSLPLITGVPDLIKNEIWNFEEALVSFPKGHPLNSILHEIIDNLKWLLLNSDIHSTIDTFAKKLHITGKYKDLVRFKKTIAVFFLFQEMRNDVDIRYDTFFASILENSLNLPSNVKIMSWNYDLQFERAFTSYSQSELEKSLRHLTVNFPNNEFDKFEHNFLHKINGMIWVNQNLSKKLLFKAVDKSVSVDFIRIILECYKDQISHDRWEDILFAWENENLDKSRVAEIRDDLIDTEILVCIGYSFPYFNRKVDKYIIQSMSKLEKVYFQNPDPNQNFERFRTIRDDLRDDQFIRNSNCNEFLLPDEL